MSLIPTFQIISNPKPRKGEPCNRCGQCCQTKVCSVSINFLQSTQAPCIALEWDAANEQYRCGMVARPGRYIFRGLMYMPETDTLLRPEFARLIGDGKGCEFEDGEVGAQI